MLALLQGALFVSSLLGDPIGVLSNPSRLMAAFISLVYWVINFIVCGDNIQRWIGILMCIYIPAVFIIVNATKEFLKRRKAERGVNRTVTTLTSFLVSFTLMGLIVFVTFNPSTL